MIDDWSWFDEAVMKYIQPILQQYNFISLIGKGYEPDENPYEMDPIAKAFTFENDDGIRFSIEILLRSLYQNEIMKHYLLRIWLKNNLKQVITINPKMDYLDKIDGWGFVETKKLDELMPEIAKDLQSYFANEFK